MFNILNSMFRYLEGPNKKNHNKCLDNMFWSLGALFFSFLIPEILMAELTEPAYIYGINLSNLLDKEILARTPAHLFCVIIVAFGVLVASVILSVLAETLRDELRANRCPMLLVVSSALPLLVSCTVVYLTVCLRNSLVWMYSASTLKGPKQNNKEALKTKTIS